VYLNDIYVNLHTEHALFVYMGQLIECIPQSLGLFLGVLFLVSKPMAWYQLRVFDIFIFIQYYTKLKNYTKCISFLKLSMPICVQIIDG
jgi:hypothetical protein